MDELRIETFSATPSLMLLWGGLVLSLYASGPPLHMQVVAQGRKPTDVNALIKNEMRERRIPGLQVAVVRHGRIVLLESYGVANVEYSVPVTNTTLFSIHSATKAFTGVAVMQLVESGQLDLNTPVAAYVENVPAAWRPITLRQLLTHVSGIPNIVDLQTGKLIVDGNEAAAWAKVQTLPMEFTPGARFGYNQTNYLVLGLVIAKVSGQSFAEFVRASQFQVSGMQLTRFGDSRDVLRNKAQSYSYSRIIDGKPVITSELGKVYAEVPALLRTAGGIDTTAEELARWIIALQQGRLLKVKESLTTLWTSGILNDGSRSKAPGGPDAGYALGWQTDVHNRHEIVGGTGGARSAFFVYPDDDLAVVILTNLQGAVPESFINDVAGYYIPDLLARTIRDQPAARIDH